MKKRIVMAAAILPLVSWCAAEADTAATAWAPSAMKTQWGRAVTPENAWRDYPRPQMVRDGWECLNGQWDYAVTKIRETKGRPEKWEGKILVPFAIESSLSGVGRRLEPDEFLWYTRKINVKKEPGRRNLLHFESVDFRAEVFIGHKPAAVPHESMNVPFTIDITDLAEDGENELTVRVWDPSDKNVYGSTGKQYLNPLLCFYTRCSGIIGTVWTETVNAAHITGYTVTPDIDAGTATFKVSASNWRETDCAVTVLDGGKEIASARGTVGEAVTVRMPDGFRLWSPDAPNLYDVKISLGGAADEVHGYFAMRKFAKMKDAKGILRFALNNEPIFVMTTLDQGWWPDGLLTPPSSEAIAFEIKTLKDCGFNGIRKHIKVEPRAYYSLCDRMGMLLLQDMPSDPPPYDRSASIDNGFNTDTWRYGFMRRDLKRVIDHLYNVPSIVVWIPYNESWGQPGEHLTHTTLDWVRNYDPSRLVNGPSGWNDYEGGNYRTGYDNWKKWGENHDHKPAGTCEAADIIDKHDYGKKPTAFPANDRRIAFIGEFGGINLKLKDHLWNPNGHFGYQSRDSKEDLEKAYIDLIAHLCGQIDGGLSGFVYTQTSDVEIETNGLLTYDREVLKFNPARLREAHEKCQQRLRSASGAGADQRR